MNYCSWSRDHNTNSAVASGGGGRRQGGWVEEKLIILRVNDHCKSVLDGTTIFRVHGSVKTGRKRPSITSNMKMGYGAPATPRFNVLEYRPKNNTYCTTENDICHDQLEIIIYYKYLHKAEANYKLARCFNEQIT